MLLLIAVYSFAQLPESGRKKKDKNRIHSCVTVVFQLSDSRVSVELINVYVCVYSVAQSCLTLQQPGLVAHQAPLSMGFSRQQY